MNRAKAFTLAGLLVGMVFLSSCAAQEGGGKVATVNGKPITKMEYERTYHEFEKALHRENASPEEKDKIDDTLKSMTVNKLIYQALVNDEAKKTGIAVTDADVRKYKQDKIFSNPVLKDQFKVFLEQNRMQESDFDAMLKDNLLLQRLMDAKAKDQAQVTDAEIKAFYDANRQSFNLRKRVHAKHILVKAIVPQMKQEIRAKDSKISDAALDREVLDRKRALKAKAEKIYEEVKANPAKFDELARKYSDDKISARRGGDLGEVMENTTDPMFWTAADKTPNGQIHPGVVSTQFGYHIVEVLDRQPPHQQTLSEVRNTIRDYLTQQKKQVFLKQWIEQQKSVARINIEPAYRPMEMKSSNAAGQLPAGETAPAVSPGAAAPAPQSPTKKEP